MGRVAPAAKKDKVYVNLNCKLNVEVDSMLREIADETDLKKTSIIERSVRAYYENYKKTGKI